MTTYVTPGTDLDLYVTKARIAETVQAYGFGCDHKDRDALLRVFTDDAKAMYDGETWLEGGATIVDWLLNALGGLAYSQHMITVPQIAVDGETAQVVAYLNAHQRAEADPAALIRMNASYTCDVNLVDGEWRISQLVLSVGWFDSGQPV